MSAGNPWSSLTATQKAMLAVGIPASAAAVYILYRRYRESQEEHCLLVGEDQIAIDMRVPGDSVKVIIGRQGATIKQLRKDTGARIEIEDGEEADADEGAVPERLLTIVGSPVQVCKAKVAIHQLLVSSAKITEELNVPRRAVGRIIGRGGESIRAICRTTGAKVVCEKESSEQVLDVRRSVRISGTRQEVASAKALIVLKVDEEEAFRHKLACSAASRRQRKQPLGARMEQVSPALSGDGSAASPESEEQAPGASEDEGEERRTNPTITVGQQEEEGASEEGGQQGSDSSRVSKFEIPSPDFSFLADEHLEVYVSATENPNHFWIQILGSRCLQLDNLTYEMSRYYSNFSGTGGDFAPKLGDIVAAPFQDNSCWYRARVLGFLGCGNTDLYYVDYGDNAEVPIGKLQILRSDFLSLPFQAVECSLDGIQPVGEEWSEEAMNCFDELTYCAEWKILLAKICSYSQRGGVTRPQVKLFDRTCDKNLDVGEELIRLGHAARCPRTAGATGGDSLDADGKAVTASLQTLLNDVAGGLDGSLVSELCTKGLDEQLSTSWQTHSDWCDEVFRSDADSPLALRGEWRFSGASLDAGPVSVSSAAGLSGMELDHGGAAPARSGISPPDWGSPFSCGSSSEDRVIAIFSSASSLVVSVSSTAAATSPFDRTIDLSDTASFASGRPIDLSDTASFASGRPIDLSDTASFTSGRPIDLSDTSSFASGRPIDLSDTASFASGWPIDLSDTASFASGRPIDLSDTASFASGRPIDLSDTASFASGRPIDLSDTASFASGRPSSPLSLTATLSNQEEEEHGAGSLDSPCGVSYCALSPLSAVSPANAIGLSDSRDADRSGSETELSLSLCNSEGALVAEDDFYRTAAGHSVRVSRTRKTPELEERRDLGGV